ncbi:hypothetical protein QBC40DRAFT_256363 [Triangularia verruculosa]|uniref:NADAR domain-containing protein n=1 Tax=Triangularia verruculosa TaxID=2587418 RepID=A0AAN6XET5_9PEZI|nr:hypothetical protein QBC40DRAFT_256363 [Triangularia verruculosa]
MAALNGDDPNRPLFFYLTGAAYGEFSQWFRSHFAVSMGEIYSLTTKPPPEGLDDTQKLEFKTAEQFMMYLKAVQFEDLAIGKKILATSDPRAQKKLGRQIKGFNDAEWDQIKQEVVVRGNMAKFGQSERLRGVLLGTGDRELVEAASNDRIWGIGFTEKQVVEGQVDREAWGENRLGRALMEARKRLTEQGQCVGSKE